MWLLRIVIGAVAVVSLAIALAPEPPARAMPGVRMNVLAGEPGATPLAGFVERDASIPAGMRADPAATLVRSWTPENGVAPLAVEFGPLAPVSFVGVIHQGTFSSLEGANALFLRCNSNARTRPIAIGNTNTTVTQTIAPLDSDFCPEGEIYLRMVTASAHNAGVAAPYEASAISFLKQSYLGLAGYFLAAFGTILASFICGGLAAKRLGGGLDAVLGGLLGVGLLSMAAFYLYAWTPLPSPVGALLGAGAIAGVALARWRAPQDLQAVWEAQRGPATAWFLASFATFTILHLASTGSGAWEAAYRFAPATWSSDHILPAMFAEAARVGQLPAEGLIGGWSLSDRPPLMAGSYLLFADLFAALQANNDGLHLQPVVLGVGGIALTGLWAATFSWAGRTIAGLSSRAAGWGVAVVAVTPLALFNTGYTWPKLLAAAFAVAAAAYAFRPNAGRPTVTEAATFGALSALAMMCHAAATFFLAPVAAIYFATRLWRAPAAAVSGAAVGLALLAAWAAFKLMVLPSHDPLMGYALTGELLLNAPAGSLAERVAERYEDLGFGAWLATKAEMASYLFTPYPFNSGQPLERPSGPLAGASLFQALRRWDFFALTAGNLPILVLGAVGAWGVVARRRSPHAVLAGRLLMAVLGCYALFLGVTFLPLYNHQFSYDAILALALAGVVVAGAGPVGQRLLTALTIAGGAYSLIVWGVAPMGSLLGFEFAALAVLAASAASGLLATGSIGPRGQVIAALGLAAALGGLLVMRPMSLFGGAPTTPVKLQSIAPALPKADVTRCLGYVDGVLERKRTGGWRVYGWAWDVAAAAPPASVRVLQADGRMLGETSSEAPRPDVQAGVSSVTRADIGWTLDLADRPRNVVALARLADGRECRLTNGLS